MNILQQIRPDVLEAVQGLVDYAHPDNNNGGSMTKLAINLAFQKLTPVVDWLNENKAFAAAKEPTFYKNTETSFTGFFAEDEAIEVRFKEDGRVNLICNDHATACNSLRLDTSKLITEKEFDDMVKIAISKVKI